MSPLYAKWLEIWQPTNKLVFEFLASGSFAAILSPTIIDSEIVPLIAGVDVSTL